MKTYPTIINTKSNKAILNKDCFAFYKYDGSNLRFEWSKKEGWHKFGSRTRVFDNTDTQFGHVIDLFLNQYSEQIEKKIVDNFNTKENITIFMEYFGSKSFAGSHEENDDFQLKLFDININKKGIVSPYEFVNIFGDLDCSAELIYTGKFDEKFIESIREDINNQFQEGIIAKGGEKHKLWMIKVKTYKYLELIKSKYQDDWFKYWE